MRRRLWGTAQRTARGAAAACLDASASPDCRFGLLAAAMWGTWVSPAVAWSMSLAAAASMN